MPTKVAVQASPLRRSVRRSCGGRRGSGRGRPPRSRGGRAGGRSRNASGRSPRVAPACRRGRRRNRAAVVAMAMNGQDPRSFCRSRIRGSGPFGRTRSRYEQVQREWRDPLGHQHPFLAEVVIECDRALEDRPPSGRRLVGAEQRPQSRGELGLPAAALLRRRSRQPRRQRSTTGQRTDAFLDWRDIDRLVTPGLLQANGTRQRGECQPSQDIAADQHSSVSCRHCARSSPSPGSTAGVIVADAERGRNWLARRFDRAGSRPGFGCDDLGPGPRAGAAGRVPFREEIRLSGDRKSAHTTCVFDAETRHGVRTP